MSREGGADERDGSVHEDPFADAEVRAALAARVLRTAADAPGGLRGERLARVAAPGDDGRRIVEGLAHARLLLDRGGRYHLSPLGRDFLERWDHVQRVLAGAPTG